MPASDIVIKGAREHNLRSVDLVLPRNKLICLTGVSGSGKSSLAFDTLYAEGQRRYVESLSTFARQFLGQMPKPEVDYIGGLSPSISISQKSSGTNPRSTVGTITEIYDYLRVLYARVGQGHCPQCGQVIAAQSREQILAGILQLPAETHFLVLAPLIRRQKGEYRDLFDDLLKQGFVRARVDGHVVSLNDDLHLDRQMRHDIEVVIDRLVIQPDMRPRLAEAVELAMKLGDGTLIIATEPGSPATGDRSPRSRRSGGQPGDIIFSAQYACASCGISFEPPSPQLFSFNSPQGMCVDCAGLGEDYSFDPELLVPNGRLSFKRGCFELLGSWKGLSHWRQQLYQDVADAVERKLGLKRGVMLETPWAQLDPSLQKVWLWGTGEQHIVYRLPDGSAVKYAARFDGIIPALLSAYRSTTSQIKLQQFDKYMRTVRCPTCSGQRLNEQARAVRLTTADPRFQDQAGRTLPEVCDLPVAEAAQFFSRLVLDETGQLIATEVLKEIRGRLGFLIDVGLDYLTLSRTAPTLSGGESQRIRLASQIGAGLVGVVYILDEPSIGLHPRDNDRLLQTLAKLRDMGNTVVVVEHDEDTMRAADYLIDFGPGPGVRGGEVVFAGPARQVAEQPQSVTGQYLAGKRKIEVPGQRRPAGEARLRVVGARHNNLKNVDVEIPLGMLVCVTGVSGSGKSSLVNDILVEALRRDLNGGHGDPGGYQRIEGLEHLDKLIAIDQSPIGRTPRSNPGTYIKVFDEIRSWFTNLPDSKHRGYKPGRFSFNVKGGRCEACKGNGSDRLEMDFLADIWVTCPVCQGQRFNRETLQIRYKGHSISDVLEMDVQQALELFENLPKIRHRLQTLHDVGLDYLKLGQPSPTLSGGEAQRIKLARELVKRSTGRTLYLLDEPTTGLHFADIELLLKVLQGFADAGNTVLVVEHNLDVVKTADWIIDLGPEGGEAGGRLVAQGTPEELASDRESHTGRALAAVLDRHSQGSKSWSGSNGKPRQGKDGPAETAQNIRVQGAEQHNLKGVDVTLVRDKMTVFCGPSGSGKSSLAMDTIYAEGQRRYVESLSAYARQFVAQMQKPRLEHIEGLSPAIAIEQKNLGHTPRSTVGTVTEIYDYLRILMARLATPYCPDCELPIGTQTADQVVDKILAEPPGTRLYLMAPVQVEVGQQYETLWDELRAAGYVRVRVDGRIHSLDQPPAIDRRRKHQVELVVDRVVVQPESRSRIAESVENGLALGQGLLHVARARAEVPESQWETVVHSQHLACDQCGRSFEPLTPHSFSFNSPLGWCSGCEGLGTQIGANLAALLQDPKQTLAEGAISLWPGLHHQVAQRMLAALGRGTGIPLDVPFDQLTARHRRILLHGADDQWFDVSLSEEAPHAVAFRFQFKGLYPALEEASRLSPALRVRLERLVDEVECSTCGGSRLRDDAAAVRFHQLTIDQLCRLPLGQLQQTIDGWQLAAREQKIAGELLREIRGRVQFLNDVGLEYLSLSRGAATLSNGEAQRIRLASQLGSGLCGVLYVLDEPTIGLHPRDNTRLLAALHKLRDLGNTLVVVEHDREVIDGSDYLCDFGPGAGRHGGQIVAQGTPDQVAGGPQSVTGPYLNGTKAIGVPATRRVEREQAEGENGQPDPHAGLRRAVTGEPVPWLEVVGARQNNLRNVHVRIPLGTLTGVTGVSGSGKSSLIEDVLYNALARRLHRARTVPGVHDEIRGLEHINKVIRVDQQPLGNSPTSNPATYTGVFERIRALYAQLPDALVRGYSPRKFSFNVPGGRCEKCEGNGQRRIAMHFLPDVWVECEACRGKRYTQETLSVTYHGRSISDVLDLPCGEAVKLFENIPAIRRILQMLCDVGLDYLTLGQAAPTLSGGEAQRVKLAAELARPDTGRTLYLLDEPTTGLHFDDLARLLDVLHRLVDLGNTVVVIEHNLDVIKSVDWILDMGPEAGDGGGMVVACGTPEDIARHAQQHCSSNGRQPPPHAAATATPSGNGQPADWQRSYTGEALAEVLAAGPRVQRIPYDPAPLEETRNGDLEIKEVAQHASTPWGRDGRRWHTRDRLPQDCGGTCHWDGQILEQVVQRLEERGQFGPTDWNHRSLVEIAGQQPGHGWFLRARTGDAWMLHLRFRVPRGKFDPQQLRQRLGLRRVEQWPDDADRPQGLNRRRGPWQQLELVVRSLDQIDKPEFWSFLDEVADSFLETAERGLANPEDVMPWKKLGQKWHFLRKGFPLGKRVLWDAEVLEELCELLADVAPQGQFLWNNQQLVYRMVHGHREPWAILYTKRCESLDLTLVGPKQAVHPGHLAQLGWDRELDTAAPQCDIVTLKFRTAQDLDKGNLADFLKYHLTQTTHPNAQSNAK